MTFKIGEPCLVYDSIVHVIWFNCLEVWIHELDKLFIIIIIFYN
jgi:hypothetical protein